MPWKVVASSLLSREPPVKTVDGRRGSILRGSIQLRERRVQISPFNQFPGCKSLFPVGCIPGGDGYLWVLDYKSTNTSLVDKCHNRATGVIHLWEIYYLGKPSEACGSGIDVTEKVAVNERLTQCHRGRMYKPVILVGSSCAASSRPLGGTWLLFLAFVALSFDFLGFVQGVFFVVFVW